MVSREKTLTQIVRRRFYHAMEDAHIDADRFVDMCVNACLQACDYAKSRGFEAYKLDIEKVRMDWAFGLESNGKTFNQRLFRIMALEKIRVLLPRDRAFEVFEIIKDAAEGSKPAAQTLARNSDWLENRMPSASSNKDKFKQAWQQSNDPLHIPKFELAARERELISALELKFLGKVSATDVLKAAQNAKRYASEQGYNGWLYKTEQLRKQYAPNIQVNIAAGDLEFASAIYRVAALEIALEMKHSDPSQVIYWAALNDFTAVASWAELCGFMRVYESEEEKFRREREETRRRWAEQESQHSGPGETYSEWFWRNFHSEGSVPFGSSSVTGRENEWAYNKETAVPAGVSWYEVLEVDKSSSLAEVKAAYRKMSLKVHPDVIGDQIVKFKFETVAAAWRVAQKVLGEK